MGFCCKHCGAWEMETHAKTCPEFLRSGSQNHATYEVYVTCGSLEQAMDIEKEFHSSGYRGAEIRANNSAESVASPHSKDDAICDVRIHNVPLRVATLITTFYEVEKDFRCSIVDAENTDPVLDNPD